MISKLPPFDVKQKPDISFVIPVHNGAGSICSTIATIASCEAFSKEIIVVDDASTDETPLRLGKASARYPFVKVITLEKNQGAGEARNVGFSHCHGRYVMFIDCDDIPNMEVIRVLHGRAAKSSAQVVVAAYQFSRDANDPPAGMWKTDQRIWKRILAGQKERLLPIHQCSSLLKSTNYPWNKIVEVEYARHIGLRFGRSKVHNDVLGHWIMLLSAERLLISSEAICTHIVPNTGANLTNIVDYRRLDIFNALDEIETIFQNNRYMRSLFYCQFIDFQIQLLKWAKSRISSDLHMEFAERASSAMKKLSYADYLLIKDALPNVANEAMKIRFDPFRVLNIQ